MTEGNSDCLQQEQSRRIEPKFRHSKSPSSVTPEK